MSSPQIPRLPEHWPSRRADVRMDCQVLQAYSTPHRSTSANSGTLHPECAAMLAGPFQRRPGCGYKAGYIDGSRSGILKGLLIGVSLTCAVMYVAAWLKVVL